MAADYRSPSGDAIVFLSGRHIMIRTTNCSKITHPNDVLSHSVSDSYSINVDIVAFRYKTYNEDMTYLREL
jgi:hypothetical protein